MKRVTFVAVAITALFAAIAGVAANAGASSSSSGDVVTIQLLDVSDWHAQLDPNDVNGTLIGGASVISTLWQQDRASNPNTLTLTAGDAFGASPPLSGFFDEEPAIRAMRLMGFDVDTFGNHNFDRGVAHLQRMINLAGAPSSSVAGKPFGYVSANLSKLEENLQGVAPWRIFEVGGVKVGVVGITNPEAPGLVFPGSFGSMVPTDPVSAANKAKARAKAAGAKVLIAITHLGIAGTDPTTGEPAGPLTQFAEAVGGFDVIFGDHTDVQYEKVINNALVVENRSKGLTYSRTFLTVDRKNGRIIERRNRFIVPLAQGVPRDAAIEDMLRPYRIELAEAFDEKIATTTGVFVRGGNVERRQEVAIGDLIADSLRATYGTQLGFTNSGGIRAALPSSYAPLDTSLRRTGCSVSTPCDLVVGDVYTVLPFGNTVLTRTVTGTQLWAALEHGIECVNSTGGLNSVCVPGTGKFPQISGFRFTFDPSRAAGSRVVSVSLDDGTPIPSDASTYTFATNDFTNAGGDGYTMFADGQGTTRDLMANVLLEYMRGKTLTPTTDGRITRLP
jgi:5'-nucleotidase